jgi:hypothetical protein
MALTGHVFPCEALIAITAMSSSEKCEAADKKHLGLPDRFAVSEQWVQKVCPNDCEPGQRAVPAIYVRLGRVWKLVSENPVLKIAQCCELLDFFRMLSPNAFACHRLVQLRSSFAHFLSSPRPFLGAIAAQP